MKTSKDFYIVKIRYYTSDYLLKKFHQSTVSRKKHAEEGKNHLDFFWLFIEKVTGKNHSYFNDLYFLNSRECAIEYIHESHGVYIIQNEVWYTYLIPKENNSELFFWMKINIKNKYTTPTRTHNWWVNREPQTWKREIFKMEEGWMNKEN